MVISFKEIPENILAFENINFNFMQNDYCELSTDQKTQMISGIVDEIQFTYKKEGIVNTNFNSNDTEEISLFAPVLLGDVTYSYCSELNISNFEFTALNEILSTDNESCNNYDLFLRFTDIDESNDLLYDDILIASDFNSECNSFNYSDSCLLSQCTLSVNQSESIYDLVLDEIYQCSSLSDCEVILKPDRISCIEDADYSYENDFSLISVENNTPSNDPISQNLFNSLDQSITIPEGYFTSLCYSLFDRTTEQLVTQGTTTYENLLLSDLIDSLELGLYWLVLEECNVDCDARNRNNLPIPFNFVYDNISPAMHTINDYSSIDRDGYGHKFLFSENINIAYTDNLVVDGENIYINGQQFSNQLINMTDTISIDKTLIIHSESEEDESYNIIETASPQNYDNYLYTSMTFQELLYSFPDILTSEETNAKFIYKLTDQSSNQSIDTLDVTIVFESSELTSDVYNFPNPFKTISSNNGTTIRYMIGEDVSNLKFFILNGSSKIVKEINLDGEYKTAGTHYYYYNGKNNMGQSLGSGLYYGFLEVNGKVHNRIKMAIFNN